jgi:hypothetical protein
VKGKFTAVVAGEFETGRFPFAPALAVIAAAAIVAWLATVIIVLAVIAGGALGIVTGLLWLASRRNPRDAELLAERFAGLHAEAARSAAPRVIENHYHLHLAPGTGIASLDAANSRREAAPLPEEDRPHDDGSPDVR